METTTEGSVVIEPVQQGRGYWSVEGTEMTAFIELRPYYCDRGRYKVLIEARGRFALEFDEQDGFPRYFFNWDRMLGELEDFMECRKQLVKERSVNDS